MNLTTTFTDINGATAYMIQISDCSLDASMVCPKKGSEGKLTLKVPVIMTEPKIPFDAKVEMQDQNNVTQFCFKFPGAVRPPIFVVN